MTSRAVVRRPLTWTTAVWTVFIGPLQTLVVCCSARVKFFRCCLHLQPADVCLQQATCFMQFRVEIFISRRLSLLLCAPDAVERRFWAAQFTNIRDFLEDQFGRRRILFLTVAIIVHFWQCSLVLGAIHVALRYGPELCLWVCAV